MPEGSDRSLLGRRFVVAAGAIDFHIVDFVRMRDLGDVIVAVVAGPHIMVFDEETTGRIVYLRPIRI